MNPRLLVSIAFALGLAVCVLTGCTQPAAPQYQPDPFGYPGLPGYCPPGGQCQPGQCPPGQCPPGCCPLPRHDAEVQGIEIGGAAPLHPVNSLAQSEVKSSGPISSTDPPAASPADEVKNGQCLPCQQQPIYRPMRQPIVQPQVPAARPAATSVSAANEVKQGRFLCERCKKPTVGRDWQEIWSDDGTSILAMCRSCYASSTPAQREATFRTYLARHNIDPAKRPYVEAAVQQAARGQ